MTVPAQFSSKHHKYTSEGLRVLALAYKQVDVDSDLNNIERWEQFSDVNKLIFSFFCLNKLQQLWLCVHREEVEKEMYFLGFLMMKNLLKPESAGVIDVLRNVNIRSVMVTGEEFCESLLV